MRWPTFDVWWGCRAPCEAVWDVLTDTTRWPEWGPSVREVVSSDRRIRTGTAGRVRTPLGFWLPFAITSCSPFESWRWRVAGIAVTGHRIAKTDAGCRIIFEVPLVAFPYALVCLAAARRIAAVAETAGI